MIEMMIKVKDLLVGLFSNRIIFLVILVCFLFYTLTANLYDLQILSGEEFTPRVRVNTVRTVPLDAPRGQAFDRFGRPLAVNEEITVIKIDPLAASARSSVEAVIDFIRLARLFGEEIIEPSTVQITREHPFEFTSASDTARRRWLLDMAVAERGTGMEEILEITAEEALEHLYAFFRIPNELPHGMGVSDRRLILEIVSAIFMNRYNALQITVARDVGPRLATAIEERGTELPNFYVDAEYSRHYPGGGYVAHLLGYIRPINAADLERNADGGYIATDLFGATGIERAFEHHMRGIRGEREVTHDPYGRRLSNYVTKPPVPGNDVFLTIDLELQIAAVHSLERVLSEILAAKILGRDHRESPVTPAQVIEGLLLTNNISITQIMEAEFGFQNSVRTHVRGNGGDLSNNAAIRAFIIEEVLANRIRPHTMVGVLHEQGTITLTAAELSRLHSATLHLPAFLSERVLAGEITPQMAYIEPFSGSVVVLETNTGAVLAAANYPNYDNNRFANAFDNNYYAALLNDPTVPMFNRAFQTNRPPGSTFKMITALAGLETGVINTNTLIRDGVTFTRAGTPHVHCWMSRWNSSHGSINVATAIEGSCNYFFFDTSLRFGNAANGTTLNGIGTLNHWMGLFGLDAPSGVETGNRATFLASPSFKEYRSWITGQQLVRSQREWTDNDTVTTAIGQSLNNYNTVVMAKYIATLANGGTRYQSHLLRHINDWRGDTVHVTQPVIEEVIPISPRNLEAVHLGMYRVIYGTQGTARNLAGTFPVTVGSKTGTAQNGTDRNDLSFAAFAPFDDPQIAVYVMLPFADTLHYPLSAAIIARDVLTCYFKADVPPEIPIIEDIFTR
jgi:cell division protein FtsI/penicillin-binding protein 2